MKSYFLLQILLYSRDDFLNEERLSLNLIILQIFILRQLTAQIIHEMTVVQLAYQDLVEPALTSSVFFGRGMM